MFICHIFSSAVNLLGCFPFYYWLEELFLIYISMINPLLVKHAANLYPSLWVVFSLFSLCIWDVEVLHLMWPDFLFYFLGVVSFEVCVLCVFNKFFPPYVCKVILNFLVKDWSFVMFAVHFSWSVFIICRVVLDGVSFSPVDSWVFSTSSPQFLPPSTAIHLLHPSTLFKKLQQFLHKSVANLFQRCSQSSVSQSDTN